MQKLARLVRAVLMACVAIIGAASLYGWLFPLT